MKKLILSCFFLALVFCACQSEKSFFSRRYTSGQYFSKAGKPLDPVVRKETTTLKSLKLLPVEEQIVPYSPEEIPEASANTNKFSAPGKIPAAKKITLKVETSSPEFRKEPTDPVIPEETP